MCFAHPQIPSPGTMPDRWSVLFFLIKKETWLWPLFPSACDGRSYGCHLAIVKMSQESLRESGPDNLPQEPQAAAVYLGSLPWGQGKATVKMAFASQLKVPNRELCLRELAS